MRFPASITTAIGLLGVPAGLLAQTGVPERSLVIAAVRIAERDPLSAESRALRIPLIEWLQSTDSVRVTPCDALLEPLSGRRVPYGSMLMEHQLLACAAFLLEYPDSSANVLAVQRAGLLGCLRAYETILRFDPRNDIPTLDLWIEFRDYGDFDAALREAVAGCSHP